VKLLVGNKSDLESSRQVKTEEGKELADSLNIKFLETSAKDSVNVEKAFITLSNEIKGKVKPKPAAQQGKNPKTLTKADEVQKKQSGCC
jgi:Ras-related protein Rab-1A